MAQEHLQELDAAIAERLRLRSQPGRRPLPGHPLEGRTILLVEDNAEYRSLVKALLMSRHPARVIEAADGRSAVAQIKRERPDLVVLDFDIPKMNGYEVLQEIRSSAELRRLPVIMLTGVPNRRQLKSMGMDVSDFLEKPVSGYELMESIAKALEAAHGAPPSDAAAAGPQTPPPAPSVPTTLGPGWSAASAFPPVGTTLPLTAAAPRDTGRPARPAVDYQELLRIQEEFLSELGHDLRAPLTSINCALRLFIDKAGAGLDSDDQEFLDISLRNCKRLEALIRDIFNFRSRSLPGPAPAPTAPGSVSAGLDTSRPG